MVFRKQERCNSCTCEMHDANKCIFETHPAITTQPPGGVIGARNLNLDSIKETQPRFSQKVFTTRRAGVNLIPEQSHPNQYTGVKIR
jgi:hypothetical protein